MKIGYCFTGSFCTFAYSYDALKDLVAQGHEIVPIMSENAYYTDTRFQMAEEFSRQVEDLCQRKVIHTIADAEPLGPAEPLDVLVVAPCTGNTLAKVASGLTDTDATMAIKANLRSDRHMLIALATNDAMSQNLKNLSYMLRRKAVYFVPMLADNPKAKPHSLVADFSLIPKALDALMRDEQLRPIFLSSQLK